MLVDAEAPVNTTPCQHLKFRDDWDLPNVDDEHCHLMVQTMEAWLIVLALLEVEKVRQVAPHCDRLFRTLIQKM